MAGISSTFLTPAQIDHFMKYGYIHLTDCFSREKAADWTRDMWTRLGYSPIDPSTWTCERINMPSHRQESIKSFAPTAWHAICELLGGEDRIAPGSMQWDNGLIVNLGTSRDENKSIWIEPKDLRGWHVDGDFFEHFLDSPEQGLLVIPLFSDINSKGGGTIICPEGIDIIATHLVRFRYIHIPLMCQSISTIHCPMLMQYA
jgi:hypothetical protein